MKMAFSPITCESVSLFQKQASGDPMRTLAAMALSRTDLNDVDVVTESAAKMRHKFSVEIKTLPVTNQERSGRCWLFAAANVLREKIAKELNLDGFELSQSYLAFWDKFERANYFLESILDTADLPTDDRTVSFILATGVHDGGQWDMFANIVEKYGVVPKDVFDETFQSSHTQGMNHVLNRNLKMCAVKLRQMVQEGKAQEEIQKTKEEMLGKIYAFLCSCYGNPPEKFDFEYVDKDDNYHLEEGFTPRSFADRYVMDLVRDAVSLIHAPTKDKPYHETYTVRYLGNVAGGRQVRHLNLPLQEFKAAIIRQLQDGQVVWFGSDVGKYGDRKKGVWDDQSYNASLLTGLDLEISKEDALDYGFSAMNHAMVITGVNLKDGVPNRWKIENSWGDENGKKGYYICSDSWFDQYVYQAAVLKKYLGDAAGDAEKEPKVLDPWDPMGTLAE